MKSCEKTLFNRHVDLIQNSRFIFLYPALNDDDVCDYRYLPLQAVNLDRSVLNQMYNRGVVK